MRGLCIESVVCMTLLACCVLYSVPSALLARHPVAVTNAADCHAWRDVVSQVRLLWQVRVLSLLTHCVTLPGDSLFD